MFTEKRAYQRILANIEARFFHDNMFYSGTVLNLSEKGMFVRTRRYLPSESKFIIVMRGEKEVLKILAKVKRVTKTDGYHDGMGIEVLNPSEEYLDFVNRLKMSMQV